MGRTPVTRLLYLVSHPIQYQAPLLRLLAADPDIELRVLFHTLPPAEGSLDAGFGRMVAWDVPLLDGYDWRPADAASVEDGLRWCQAAWLHGWEFPLFRHALKRAAALGKPVMMRGENWDGAMPETGWRGWVKRRYLRAIFARCHAFLAIGSANAAYYRRHGIDAARIFTVPYAVDNDFFTRRAAQAHPHRRQMRHDLGLPEHGQVILYCGKMQPRKRPDLLVRAWRDARWPDQRRPLLLMVGDGEMRPALQQMAPDACFPGFRNQTELPALYDLADVFVLASEREPWGLAVNEAMACGTAVVVSDQVGAAFDLVDVSCGRVVPTADADALSRALVEVLADSQSLGHAAAAKVATWNFAACVAGIKQALDYCRKTKPCE